MKDNKIFIIIIATLLLAAAASLTYLESAYGAVIEGWDEMDDGTELEEFMMDEDLAVEENFRGAVDMEQEFLDGDLLKISVKASDMSTPVLGLAFNLNYDGKKLKFLKYEPGEFLERGGDPFYLVKNDEAANKIVFGETLRRDDQFPLGEGRIADFYFQIPKKTALDFTFAQGTVSTLDTVRQDIDKINWKNLSLDKRGRKIVAEEDDVRTESTDDFVETNASALPINWVIIFVMGVVIIGLGVWIFINRKKGKRYDLGRLV